MTAIFKRAKIASAVAATLTAGLAATSAQAVNISDTGLGEVAIIPYYTVRNGIDTNISMVNTHNKDVVAVKLRFRERENSRDVRDFNIFLSPNDVWTGVVTLREDGRPVVQTSDTTCTAPALYESEATVPGMRGIGFTASGYGGAVYDPDVPGERPEVTIYPQDGGPTDITRSYDGHIEVIVMGTSDPYAVDDPYENRIAQAAMHEDTRLTRAPGTGVPRDCDFINERYVSADGMAPFKQQFDEPLNVLKVSANLMMVDRGIATTIPVDHLANFYNPDDPTDDLLGDPSGQTPNLRDVTPKIAAQIVEGTGLAIAPTPAAAAGVLVDTFFNSLDPADPVSALYMATGVVNEFAIGGAGNALYDWTLVFPTKNFYVDTFERPDAPIPPFNEAFQPNGRSCEVVNFEVYDREEFADVPKFSPLEPYAPFSICQEANVLYFNSGNGSISEAVPNGPESVLVGVPGTPDFIGNVYQIAREYGTTSGWMRTNFLYGLGIAGDTYYYPGLPVTGFGIKTYSNGTASGFIQEHGYIREQSL